jgi:hypothetical protein
MGQIGHQYFSREATPPFTASMACCKWHNVAESTEQLSRQLGTLIGRVVPHTLEADFEHLT